MALGVPNQYNGLTSREGLYHALGQMFTAGVVSGFNVRQAASPGMRVVVGGESSSPDDALLFDESTGALYPLFQNKGGQAVAVNINPASSSQKRITSIVAYCKVGAPTSQSSPDNQSTVGVIAVDGLPTSGTPQEPSESVIKAAITGQSAYVVLANISVKAGINRILDADITNGVKRATLKTDKIDFASLNKYSTEERIIGEWIDDRPVYQKTFDITVDFKQNQYTNVPHGISGITDNFVVVSTQSAGAIGRTSGAVDRMIPRIEWQHQAGLIAVEKDNLVFASSWPWGRSRVILTIQYVK